MRNTSAAFKTNIIDGTSPQDLLITFDDGIMLSGLDGDFTSDGVTLTDALCEDEDIRFGGFVAKTLSCNIMNYGGGLYGYGFGRANVRIGVAVQSGAISPFPSDAVHFTTVQTGTPAYLVISSGKTLRYATSGSGPWTSVTFSDEIVGLLAVSGTLYVATESGVKTCTPPSFTFTDVDSSQRWINNVAHHSDTEFFNGQRYDYILSNGAAAYSVFEYAHMGTFLLGKPESTKGLTINITDAYDERTPWFDTDALTVVDGMNDTFTLAELCNAVTGYVAGLHSATASLVFSADTVTYPRLLNTFSKANIPSSDFTCRDVIKWAAEYCFAFAFIDYESGALKFRKFSGSSVTVNADNIPVNGSVIAEYQTPSVTKVVLKAANGNVLSGGTDGAAYTVYGNPLFSTITADDVTGAATVPVFTPAVEETIYADPSVEPGDSVDGENSFPLMRQTIHWAKYTESTYEATGTANRPEDPLLQNAYIARVSGASAVNAMNQRDVFNKLTNNGEMQGMFLDGDGNIYINGTYIQAHTIGADRLDVSDLYAIGATIGGFTIDSDSIRSGAKTDTASGAITLSIADFSRLINNVLRSGLRFAIGDSFAVTKTGGVYLSNVTIDSGASGSNDGRLRIHYDDGTYTWVNENAPGFYKLNVIRDSDSEVLSAFTVSLTAAGGCIINGGIYLSGDTVTRAKNSYGDLATTGQSLSASGAVTATAMGFTEVSRLTLDAGVWLVMGYGQFPAITSGSRRILLSDTVSASDPVNLSADARCDGTAFATAHFATVVTTAGTYVLRAYHSNATDISVTGELRAVRIA